MQLLQHRWLWQKSHTLGHIAWELEQVIQPLGASVLPAEDRIVRPLPGACHLRLTLLFAIIVCFVLFPSRGQAQETHCYPWPHPRLAPNPVA